MPPPVLWPIRTKSFLKDHLVQDVLMKEYKTIDVHEPLRTAVAMLLNGQCKTFLVTDNETPVGVLTREHIIKLLSDHSSDTPVRQGMETTLLQLESTTPLDESFQKMMETKAPLALIYQQGNFIGVVDMENIAEFIMIKNAASKEEQE